MCYGVIPLRGIPQRVWLRVSAQGRAWQEVGVTQLGRLIRADRGRFEGVDGETVGPDGQMSRGARMAFHAKGGAN